MIPIEHQERKNYIFAEMRDNIIGRIDSDQTGASPVVSSQLNCYVFILYYCDSNIILAEPMKPRKVGEILGVYIKLFLYIHKKGLQTKLQRLENE